MADTAFRHCVLAPLVLALALAIPGAALADFGDKKPISYSVDGATPTGYFKVVGEAINGIVREAYPGTDATYKPGSPAGGILNIATGKSDFTWTAAAPEINHALDGKAPFKESLKGKFAFVLFLHGGLAVHNLMTRDWADRHGIRSFEDFVAKKPAAKLGVNTVANLQSTLSMYLTMFEVHGLKEPDLMKIPGIELFRGNTAETLSHLKDGKVDIVINGAFLPSAEIADIHRGRPLRWIEASEARIKQAAELWGNFVQPIKAGIYPFVERDTFTTTQWTTGVAGSHVSEETVYKMLKALHDNQDRVRKIHPSLADFSAANAARNPTRLPYHPGAARFYKEVGVLK